MTVRFLNYCTQQVTDDLEECLMATLGQCDCVDVEGKHSMNSVMFVLGVGTNEDFFVWSYDSVDRLGRHVYLGVGENRVAFHGWSPKNPDTWALLGGIGAAIFEAKMGRRS